MTYKIQDYIMFIPGRVPIDSCKINSYNNKLLLFAHISVWTGKAHNIQL